MLAPPTPRAAAIAAWLIVFCQVSHALDPGRAMSQYHKHQWQVEDGLPRNYVMSVLPAEDGYLLVGTDEGMVRFDGMRFTRFDGAPSLGLSQRWILTMIPARGGGMWIGTFDGWVYRIRDGALAGRLEAGASVFALVEDDAGRLWASTRNGVLVANGNSLQRVPGLAGPPDLAWNVLAVDSERCIWVVTVDGLFRLRDGTQSRVLPNYAQYGEIVSVSGHADGGVWAGTSNGLFRVRPKHSGASVERKPGVPGPVVAVEHDRDGMLWAGTWGKGLYRVRGETVDAWSSRDGLADDYIRTFYEDREGNLWIGTRSGGLTRWNDTLLIPHGVPEGLLGDFATTILEGRRGELWFGTWRGGLYRLRNGVFESRPTPAPTLYFAVRAIAIDPQGNPWIGNWEGLYGFDGSRYTQFAPPGSPYRRVSALLFDRTNRLWIGSDEGLFRFPPGRPSGTPESLAGKTQITALLEDSRGTVWAGTPGGLIRLRESAHDVGPMTDLPREFVTSISEDARGRICATTLNGSLHVISGGRALVLDRRNGLPGYPLYRILDDNAGSYWISSGRGILRIGAADFDRALSSGAHLDFALYDRNDGMRTIECHRISQPAGWRDSSGRVWFPTAKGFVEIRPGNANAAPPPRVLIESASADGRSLSPANIRLEPGTHALAFQYTAFSFSHPEKLRFRYRLEGFDAGWVEAGADRTARYSRIPPGSYRFQVAARMPGAAWTATPAALAIVQLPRWHQTVWFYAVLLLIAAAAVTGTFRWRVFIIKGRYSAVLAERNRIAREWHDTLLAGFSAISWQLEETLSRLKDAPATAAATVELALKMVRHYRVEARNVIWGLRETGIESETLEASIRAAVRKLAEGTALRAEVHVAGQPVKLDEDLERNALRIVQEAVSNAKNHGRASAVDVTLGYDERWLTLRIEDDGTGFSPESVEGVATGHFGLTMMRERAGRFGGALNLIGRPGRGTIVEAKIPVKTQGRK